MLVARSLVAQIDSQDGCVMLRCWLLWLIQGVSWEGMSWQRDEKQKKKEAGTGRDDGGRAGRRREIEEMERRKEKCKWGLREDRGI